MSSESNPLPQSISDLLGKLFDAGLSDAERSALFAELQQDDAKLERYLDHIMLHSQLRMQLGAGGHPLPGIAAVSMPEEAAEIEVSRPMPVPLFVAKMGAGFRLQSLAFFCLGLIIALVGALGWINGPQGRDTKTQEVATALRSLPVAYLMDASGCSWGSQSLKACAVGDSLESGSEVSLHEGVAEFRLANGVYLGVQGPASLLLASPSTVVLQYGKVTAQVVPTGQDFKVFAGGNRVAAYDAEFGVHLTESKLDIHAFSGEVSATSALRPDAQLGTPIMAKEDDGKPQAEQSYVSANVTSGRALLLTAYDKSPKILGWSEAQPDKFVSNLNMSGPLPLTQTYVDVVMASQPISYWRFERTVGNAIPNEIPNGPKLWLKGQSSLVGSEDNHAAELRWEGNWHMASTRTAKLPLADSDYTLEAWIKPSHHHRACVFSLGCGDEHSSGARFELQGGENDAINPQQCGVLRYFHRAYAGKEHFGTSCFSKHRYNARRWQHIVALKKQDTMKLFVNGRFAGSANDQAQLPHDAIVLVGIYGDRKTRRFIGQLDEIAIYNRALSYKEIQQHFQAVSQAADTAPKRSVATGTNAGDDA